MPLSSYSPRRPHRVRLRGTKKVSNASDYLTYLGHASFHESCEALNQPMACLLLPAPGTLSTTSDKGIEMMMRSGRIRTRIYHGFSRPAKMGRSAGSSKDKYLPEAGAPSAMCSLLACLLCLQVHRSLEHLDKVLTGTDLSQMASQCMQDTELVYAKDNAHVKKTMLLVAVPACSAAIAGKNLGVNKLCHGARKENRNKKQLVQLTVAAQDTTCHLELVYGFA